jgi:galactokinase
MAISFYSTGTSKSEPVEFSDGAEPHVLASAPGPVQFVGNHTDYNGGWVLGSTINRRMSVGVTFRGDQQVSLESASAQDVPPVRLSLSMGAFWIDAVGEFTRRHVSLTNDSERPPRCSDVVPSVALMGGDVRGNTNWSMR